MDKLNIRKATITSIIPSRFTDTLGYSHNVDEVVHHAGLVGRLDVANNGSWNRVLQHVQVGDEGYVEFVSSGLMALWHWRSKANW